MELEFLVLFNIAFFSSIGHCVGMCGGIVLSLNSKIAQHQLPVVRANLLYNVGRISSYLCIGALCGGMGMIFQINPTLKGITLIGIGILVALFGICMLCFPKYLSKLEPSLDQNQTFKTLFLKFYHSKSLGSFFVLGVLNGFLPCGIVYYFALVALASAEVWKGIAVMGIFGISTLIPMLFVGMLSGLLLNSKLKSIMLKISAGVMIGFGIYTMYKGMRLF